MKITAPSSPRGTNNERPIYGVDVPLRTWPLIQIYLLIHNTIGPLLCEVTGRLATRRSRQGLHTLKPRHRVQLAAIVASEGQSRAGAFDVRCCPQSGRGVSHFDSPKLLAELRHQ